MSIILSIVLSIALSIVVKTKKHTMTMPCLIESSRAVCTSTVHQPRYRPSSSPPLIAMSGFNVVGRRQDFGLEELREDMRGLTIATELNLRDDKGYIMRAIPRVPLATPTILICDKFIRRRLDYNNACAQQHATGSIREFVAGAHDQVHGTSLLNLTTNPFCERELDPIEIMAWFAAKNASFGHLQKKWKFASGNTLLDMARVDTCSRTSLLAIKRVTRNYFEHNLKLRCMGCDRTLKTGAMVSCERCMMHIPICSRECFKLYWKHSHKGKCGVVLAYRAIPSGAVDGSATIMQEIESVMNMPAAAANLAAPPMHVEPPFEPMHVETPRGD